MTLRYPLNYTVTLAAGGTFFVDLMKDGNLDDNGLSTKEVAPCANIVIFNSVSNQLVKYYKNGQEGFKAIPGSTIFTDEDAGIRNVKLVNEGSSSTVVYVTLDNEPSELFCLRKLAGVANGGR